MIALMNISLLGFVLVLGGNVTAALGLWVPDHDIPLLLNHKTHILTPQETPPRHSPIVRPRGSRQVLHVGTADHDVPIVEDPSKDSYSVIVEKDLFHPTRKKHIVPKALPRPLPKKTAQVKAPNPRDKLPGQSPTHPKRTSKKKRTERLALQGIVIFGDYQRALIADLLRKPRDPMDVGIGDTVGRYTVKEILEDRVILSAGDNETRTLELMAEDKLNRRSHIVTSTSDSGTTKSTSSRAKKRAKKAKK